jgi:L-lactate dehydrogenase complex protein LldE
MSEAGIAAAGGARVGLLVTCLIDSFRPDAGFAAVQLLEDAGYEVVVPAQGCCGQPNFNGGDKSGAQAMAKSVLRQFVDCDYVVVPSGSCAAMLSVHYPELFPAGSDERRQADELAGRTWELSAFLHDVARFESIDAQFNKSFAIHDSCSALRELGIREQPRALLGQVRGGREQELANPDVCCGFGGLFCVKYPAVSNRIAQKKIADLQTTAEPLDAIVSTDLGCLMHLEGKLRRDGSDIKAWHIAEVLAGHAESQVENNDADNSEEPA